MNVRLQLALTATCPHRPCRARAGELCGGPLPGRGYHVARFRAALRVWPRQAAEAQCPVCGRDSVLVFELDRFVHLDGSRNARCWARISSELNG